MNVSVLRTSGVRLVKNMAGVVGKEHRTLCRLGCMDGQRNVLAVPVTF